MFASTLFTTLNYQNGRPHVPKVGEVPGLLLGFAALVLSSSLLLSLSPSLSPSLNKPLWGRFAAPPGHNINSANLS